MFDFCCAALPFSKNDVKHPFDIVLFNSPYSCFRCSDSVSISCFSGVKSHLVAETPDLQWTIETEYFTFFGINFHVVQWFLKEKIWEQKCNLMLLNINMPLLNLAALKSMSFAQICSTVAFWDGTFQAQGSDVRATNCALTAVSMRKTAAVMWIQEPQRLQKHKEAINSVQNWLTLWRNSVADIGEGQLPTFQIIPSYVTQATILYVVLHMCISAPPPPIEHFQNLVLFYFSIQN